jgi:hypothetical protein
MGNPSDVNMQSTQCSACPTGSTTSGTGGKSVSDCNGTLARPGAGGGGALSKLGWLPGWQMHSGLSACGYQQHPT